MKTAFWLGLGVLILAGYLPHCGGCPEQVAGLPVLVVLCDSGDVLLVAMGIDFVYLISFQNLATGESFKKHMFEATFLNSNSAVMIISWLAVLALFYFIWSKGMGLKGLLKPYIPAQTSLMMLPTA